MPKIRIKTVGHKRPKLAERLTVGLDEVARYFRGEPTGVKAVWPVLTPALMAIQQLIQARKRAGLSIPEVASASGLTVARIKRLETGAIKNPTVEALTRYALAVGLELRMSLEPTDPNRLVTTK